MRTLITCLAFFALLHGCKGKDGNVGGDTSGRALHGSSAEPGAAPVDSRDGESEDDPVDAKQSYKVEPSPDGSQEMLPGILPGTIVSADAGAGGALKTDRTSLVAAAREALGSGELDEAAAIVDTILLLMPDDPEALEIRAKALTAQGQEEQGRSDLKRCCELGRSSCCPTERNEKSEQGR